MPASPLNDRFRRVAVTHEWWTKTGGSEQVVLQILELFPEADVFLSVLDRSTPLAAELAGHRVHTSYLDRLPWARRFYPWLLPLMPTAFEAFDLSSYDLVISSSHAFAKNVVTGPDALHVCYCHTPMRYAWDPTFLRGERLGPLGGTALAILLSRLRRQDLLSSSRPDHYLANSTAVADRIAKFYRRSATVLHPPVEVAPYLATERAQGDYYLYLGRLVPYKRVDLAVAACALLDRPLKVAGDGRGFDEARRGAGPRTEFLGRVSDDELPGLFAGARALLFPAEEDFGIIPVEAQAAGVPVIAFGRGGATDSVVDGATGLFFDEQTAESLCEAILAFEGRSWPEGPPRANAKRFAPEVFHACLTDFLLNAPLAGAA